MDDQKFRTWKQHLVPFLYDWITNHNLTWPSQTCRWGPKIEDSPHKIKYRLYMSEQTDGSEPQKITVCTADVFKPRAAGPEAVSNWSEFSKSPYVKEQKVIFHPGEVNKIRELQQHPNIIITHTDAPELFVWNVDKQPARQKKEEKEKRSRIQDSVADLQLIGHKDNAQFPLATCSSQPVVASGGTDHLVLTWNLQDSMETVLAGAPSGGKHAPTLQANQTLLGHSDTVEDVVFKPGTPEQLASVGDDHLFLLWDTRQGTSPVTQVAAAHGSHDIHCVDWSALQEELIATGAADGSLKIWDLRKLGGTSDYLYNFEFHQDATMRVEWHPGSRGVLASGGDDRIVAVWNLNSDGTDVGPQNADVPPQLMFQHLGHKNGKVVDFQWNNSDTWLLMSVSDDTDGGAGGGTLQLWRINDMIYRPEEQVIQELESDREFILTGKHASKPAKAAGNGTANGASTISPDPEPEATPAPEPGSHDATPTPDAEPAQATVSKEEDDEAAAEQVDEEDAQEQVDAEAGLETAEPADEVMIQEDTSEPAVEPDKGTGTGAAGTEEMAVDEAAVVEDKEEEADQVEATAAVDAAEQVMQADTKQPKAEEAEDDTKEPKVEDAEEPAPESTAAMETEEAGPTEADTSGQATEEAAPGVVATGGEANGDAQEAGQQLGQAIAEVDGDEPDPAAGGEAMET